ncbi:MAG: FAD-binding protein [Actinomycetota bacterium]|nr:FAD-binding protein [Actinomycetota bacterium]
MADLVVAGAGMAGLVAAARARELGASVVVHEKGDRPGGSMLLSGGFVWRYREWDRFRAECPCGDPGLQRLVWERLDDALAWLESLGAPVLARETGNWLTSGRAFDTRGLTGALVRRAGDLRLSSPLRELSGTVPVILATGGFHAGAELVRRYVTPEANELLLRGNPWSAGDGLRLGLERGASLSKGIEEFYGRNMPAPPARIAPADFRPAAQVYARHARVSNARGEGYVARTWSEIDVVQWTARQPRARAWYAVPDARLGERVRERTVADLIDAARAAGAPVERRPGETIVEVVAGITTTLGGLRIDGRARAADGVYACGADAGGISTGGWASTLAAALVLGRIAAEDAVAAAC